MGKGRNKNYFKRLVFNLITAISAIIIFSLLVLFHEAGHFTIAKLAGIKVHEFAIGMGPKLLKYKKGETLYSIRAFPIGGFVKMEGEDESSEDERAFNKKPIIHRIAVVAAGAIMNFILGFIIFIIMFLMVDSIPQPVIEEVIQDMPAQKAGLLQGDRIIKLNNSKIRTQKDISYFLLRSEGENIQVTVERNGERLEMSLAPEFNEEEDRYMMGYSFRMEETNFTNAIYAAYHETLFMTKLIFVSLGQLITGKVSVDQMAGPVGIVREIGGAARAGILQLLQLAALISINLGLFNLLPIPALDGSRIVFLVIEGIRRKPINPEKEGMVHMVGFALLMVLLLVVTFSDISKLFGG
jgi:regulator of sigma E protease